MSRHSTSDSRTAEPEPGPILVVEDSATERLRLAALLEKLGNRVVEASNGQDAIELFRHHTIEIVVSDWNMPLMSGLELCAALHDMELAPYFILVTGRNSHEEMVTAMESGADDFITKPFNSDELRVRLLAGQRMMKLRRALESRNRQLQLMVEREQQAAEQARYDLEIASRMLFDLLTDDRCQQAPLRFAGLLRPAAIIGGDFYNFFPLGPHHYGFYLLDVSGHGVPSALLVFMLARVLAPDPVEQSILQGTDMIFSTEWVLHKVNQRVVDRFSTGIYSTMIYGTIDSRSGEGELCQAGHPHPLHIDQSGHVSPIEGGGLPIGMIPDVEYKSSRFRLAAGERLLLYTDGLTEARTPAGDWYGEERLKSAIAARSHQPVDRAISGVVDEVAAWQAEADASDDIACLVIEYQPDLARSDRSVAATGFGGSLE